jgi:hypothetical protein
MEDSRWGNRAKREVFGHGMGYICGVDLELDTLIEHGTGARAKMHSGTKI